MKVKVVDTVDLTDMLQIMEMFWLEEKRGREVMEETEEEGGVAVAEALKVNTTLQHVE